jgi:hypothetical protein
MGYIQKEWVNPTNVDATELNRIEKGIKDSHETLAIVSGELANLQLKHINSEKEITSLLKNSPNILQTLTDIKSLVSNNSSLIETLKDTSNLITKEHLDNLSKSFLHITSIEQDGNNIFSNGKVTITTPTVDSLLNRTSQNAISNKAVTLALEQLTSNIKIPTKLSDLKEDYNHKLITEDERILWNTIKDISFEETDPTVPHWAKQKDKPSYEWNEILNTPKIYKSISEFPDESSYSRTTHNHNSIYALLQHEHDNRYSDIDHSHSNYSDIKHSHNDLYAAKDHTHDIDLTSITNNLQNEIITRQKEDKLIIEMLNSLTNDYNDLTNRPDLSIYALDVDLKTHTHNNLYALLEHYHNYAEINHSHDSLYSTKDHSHDSLYSAKDHTHSEYSLNTHNHDFEYSPITHTHSLLYSDINHTHDNLYSSKEHSHSEYSLNSHTHDYSSVYSDLNHNHDSLYSKITHSHNEFANIVDTNTVNSLISKAIDALINGADGTYDTLKELQTAIESNDDLIEALNAAVTNHNHDSAYASLNHNHDSTYASLNHNHEKEDITNFSHTHTESDISDFKEYLPLTAGSSNPLSGILYANSGVRISSGNYLIFADEARFITPNKVIRFGSSADDNSDLLVMTQTYLRPNGNSTTLGNSSNQWKEIYGTTIYQNGKQVANKEDIPSLDNYITKDGFTMKASSTVGKFYYNTGTGEQAVQVVMPTIPDATTTALALDGSNTMTGVLNLKASGNNEGNIGNNGIRWNLASLPQSIEPEYVCVIDGFAIGGRQKWSTVLDVHEAMRKVVTPNWHTSQDSSGNLVFSYA